MNNESKNDKTNTRTKRSNNNNRGCSESEDISSERRIQQRKSGTRNNSGCEEEKGSGGSGGSSRIGSGQNVRKKNNKSNTSIKSRIGLRLEDIRKALSNQQLRDLLINRFDLNKKIEISYNIEKKSFSEDFLRTNIKEKKYKVKTTLYPSKEYGKYYEDWKQNKQKCDERVVFGCYVVLYRKLFCEEDPEYVNKSCKQTLFIIKKMAYELTNGDFIEIVEYLETLLPLWEQRLVKNASFPNFRPSTKTLFTSRKFWAQRYTMIRNWQQ